MTDLTVVILTKNEEKNLRKCVESFRGVAKRFVIVDSFSTDGTEALCKELNAELQKIGSSLDFYQNKWISYADQLNWGLQNTGIDTEWSMRMDADEEIMEDLAAEIDEKLPNVKEPVNGIILRRRVYFMGRWIKHGGRYPELLLRISRTGKASCEMKIMDEHMILSEGTTVEFKNDLIDNNQKDLEWWTAKHNWYSNREVLDHQMTLENEMDESLEQDGTSSGQAKIMEIPLVKYWSVESRYALIYNFPGNQYLMRNFGPYHEGGMFAIFVSLAMLLLFEQDEMSKKRKKYVIIYAATVVTTFSTTGILLLLIILIGKIGTKVFTFKVDMKAILIKYAMGLLEKIQEISPNIVIITYGTVDLQVRPNSEY